MTHPSFFDSAIRSVRAPRKLALAFALAGLLATPAIFRAAAEIPGYVVLPLAQMGRANQASIRVTLNGQSTMLVLDTGASSTTLDTHFYRGARSKPGSVGDSRLPAELQRKTNANGQDAEVGYIDSLKAGAMDFGKGPTIVTDLTSILGVYNAYHHNGAVAGLLGEDILHRYSAIIDWRRRGVYFNTNPSKRIKLGPALVSSGWTPIPLAPTSSRQLAVECTVSNKPVRLIVDTGAGFTTFAPGIVPLDMIYGRDRQGSMRNIVGTDLVSSMVGGDSVSHPAEVNHWKIGSYEIPSWNVAVHKLPAGLLAQESAGAGPVLGLLGSEILAANNAIIDIAGPTLYLKPKGTK